MKKILTSLISLIAFATVYAVVAPLSSPQVGYTPVNGRVLLTNGTSSTWVATSTLGLGGGSSGTVTSVSLTTPTGLTAASTTCTTACVLGVSLTSGYVIPLIASTTEWATAYASTSNITPTWIRGLFSGTSPITYSSGVIGIDLASSTANGYLSSTDWSTFNNKVSNAYASSTFVSYSYASSTYGLITGNNTWTGSNTFATTTARNLAINGTAGNGYITLVGQSANPASPTAGSALIHAATTNGFTRFEQDNEAGTNVVLARDSVTIARNTSGGVISKGQVVYITGSTGNVPNIAKALGSSTTTLPSVFMVVDDIADNASGQVMRSGIISGFDTSAFTAGQAIYLSTTTAGGLTITRPSGMSYVQRIGTVLVSGVGNGSVDVNIAPAVQNMETGTNQTNWSATNVIASGTLSVAGKSSLGLASSTAISTGNFYATGTVAIATTTITGNLSLTGAFIPRVVGYTSSSTITLNVNTTDEATTTVNQTTTFALLR